MQQNYSFTKLPTVGASSPLGGASAWSNPSRITADDGSSASWGAFAGGQNSAITGSVFAFPKLPASAVIDGIQVTIDGVAFSVFGTVNLNISGSTGVDIGTLSQSYGGPNYKWGKSSISVSDVQNLAVTVSANDISGGDGTASIDYFSVTVYYHIDAVVAPADVPTRLAYKVYSEENQFLGELPNVSSKFGFSQDINSAGSTIQITCGQFVNNEVTVDPLLDNAGSPIQTQSGLNILTRFSQILVAPGASDDAVLFKNSNRIKVVLYNKWYPNGKLMFSGQVNKVAFQYGGGNSQVNLTVYSDGIDLDNYIARGYPFNYTTDVSQTTSGDSKLIRVDGGDKGAGWQTWGQSFRTGVSATNIGAITLRLFGTANVTIDLYDAPNGNLIGSVTRSVSTFGWEDVRFEYANLVPTNAVDDYFFAVWVDRGQTIYVATSPSTVYPNGELYQSDFTGTSGGSFYPIAGDMYFITAYGTPTTTTTYSTDDPVSEMAHGILLDYNARGGVITERDFTATGLSLTYTFNSATIFDAIKKVLEMSPTGYYSYIDLGTAEIDIKPTPVVPDFIVTRGKDINQLTISMSIEQVKNYLLLSGGDTGGGTNLFRQYQDSESVGRYGARLAQKSDNRITLSATADAIGDSFIDENAGEIQETSLTVLNDLMDVTLLTPGKTIGFNNFGNFIDDLVLQIARRDYQPHAATLTLGRLPVTQPAEIQRISRELMLEQTISNPNAPS